MDILIILTVSLKYEKMWFDCIFLWMNALWKVSKRYVDILKLIQLDLDVKFRIKIHIQYCIYQWKVQYQAHVQYSKEVFSIISVDKKLVPILLEEMKWPPAGNFKSHSKYLLKFEEAVFLIFNEDTMDFKKLVNYISEFVLQVRVLPYLQ